jgi:hypothetical protein
MSTINCVSCEEPLCEHHVCRKYSVGNEVCSVCLIVDVKPKDINIHECGCCQEVYDLDAHTPTKLSCDHIVCKKCTEDQNQICSICNEPVLAKSVAIVLSPVVCDYLQPAINAAEERMREAKEIQKIVHQIIDAKTDAMIEDIKRYASSTKRTYDQYVRDSIGLLGEKIETLQSTKSARIHESALLPYVTDVAHQNALIETRLDTTKNAHQNLRPKIAIANWACSFTYAGAKCDRDDQVSLIFVEQLPFTDAPPATLFLSSNHRRQLSRIFWKLSDGSLQFLGKTRPSTQFVGKELGEYRLASIEERAVYNTNGAKCFIFQVTGLTQPANLASVNGTDVLWINTKNEAACRASFKKEFSVIRAYDDCLYALSVDRKMFHWAYNGRGSPDKVYPLHAPAVDFELEKRNLFILYEDGTILIHGISERGMSTRGYLKLAPDPTAKIAANEEEICVYHERQLKLYKIDT